MLQKLTALQIISEVLAAVMEWRSLVTRLGIAKSEQERFVAAFERKFGLYNESEVKVGGCPSITNILG